MATSETKQYPLVRVRQRSKLAKAIETGNFRSFGPRGNLEGMRIHNGWSDAAPVQIGEYVYDLKTWFVGYLLASHDYVPMMLPDPAEIEAEPVIISAWPETGWPDAA